MERRQMMFWSSNEYVKIIKKQSYLKLVIVLNYIIEEKLELSIEERLGVETLGFTIMNFDGKCIYTYDKFFAALNGVYYTLHPPNKWDIHLRCSLSNIICGLCSWAKMVVCRSLLLLIYIKGKKKIWCWCWSSSKVRLDWLLLT